MSGEIDSPAPPSWLWPRMAGVAVRHVDIVAYVGAMRKMDVRRKVPTPTMVEVDVDVARPVVQTRKV